MKNVLIVGSWHLGSVVGACIADAGNNVYFWDQNPKTAQTWAMGKPPIQEPGLNEMVANYWGKTINWAHDLGEVSKKADWIVLAYDTPVNEKDEIEFGVVEEGFNQVLENGFSERVNFFFTAQIPVGTSRRFLSRVKETHPQWNGQGYYMPENLRLGEAIKSFKTPDRMVIGVNTSSALEREQAIRQWRDLIQDQNTPINIMGLESAEMVKHALNAFLGTCVVFARKA
jgi:UDPglucose 6-dehydrogenase